jgi:hypothetical protein
MIEILAITGPIYLAITLGYLTTRWGVFQQANMRVFGKFTLNLALPLVLSNALPQRHGYDAISAAAVRVTTVGLFFTLIGLLWVLQHVVL